MLQTLGGMLDSAASMSPTLVWGLFTRGLGVVLLISFLSLVGQIVRGAGGAGGMPIARRLGKVKEDFPSWRRFYYFPTLLWLNDSDAMLRLLCWVGIGSSVLVIYGGPFSFFALLACYLCYLSLDMAIGLIFPWDCLMFESLVLALFLPPTHSLPSFHAVSAPAPALAWAYRLLLFRVMFGFGKQKFMGSKSKDLAYLKGFLIAQPLPSPLGWYVHKLPTFLLKQLVLFMFVAEIPVPFFAFFPGKLSVICAAVTAFLMIGIQAMGSFGYFSLLTIAGCIPLLDNVTPGQLQLGALFGPGKPNLVNAFVALHTVASVVPFLFNSWVAQIWFLWSTWYRLPRLLQLPLDFYRFMHPFRWLHAYGVFPPNTSPGVKISLLVEVSWDRQTWHELEFTYSPSNPRSPPKFVAPFHPRGDQAVIYETFGLNPTSLIAGTLGPWDPYTYGAQPAANTLLQCIIEGRGRMFMKDTGLKDRADPPVMCRITTVMLEPVSIQHHLKTGEWWKRSYIGPHTAPRASDPRFWQDFLPEPEMWHFEAIFWRRRSKLHALMERSRRGEDPMQLALADAEGLSQQDADRFWNELVPLASEDKRKTFDSLPGVVAQVRERYDGGQRRALHRLLGRYSLLLVARLEPLYLGRGLRPPLPATTYFQVCMLAQHVIAKGKAAYLAAMADPISVAAELPALTPQSGLYLLSIFRYESMIFDAQKLRLVTAFMPPHDPAQKLAMAHSLETGTEFERFVARLAEAFSGFFGVMPIVRDNFHGPSFDGGFPELYPSFRELDNGEVVLREYAKPEAGVAVPGAGSQPAE